MKLYGYWRSSSSYRLRIALALKGLTPDQAPVHLVRNGGEHNATWYRALNPQGRVPSLALDGGDVLFQSPAIIEYLEEVHPEPPLLPADPIGRARARGVAAIIGCDVHSLHNAGTLTYLRREFGRSEAEIMAWVARWIDDGLSAVEQLIDDKDYCLGPEPGLADVYLVPQLYTAERFKVSLKPYRRIRQVGELAARHPAFQSAHPSCQPDAE